MDDTCYDDPDFAQLGPSNPITGFALNCEAFARPELEGICGREGSRKDRNGLTANEGSLLLVSVAVGTCASFSLSFVLAFPACCGCGGSGKNLVGAHFSFSVCECAGNNDAFLLYR